MRFQGDQKEFARDLRKNLTDAERHLWRALRNEALGIKFRRQTSIGPYVADFACLEKCLVIEVDGGQHSGSQRDEVRDEWLRDEGFRILRYWNNEVLTNLEGVLYSIQQAIKELD